MGTLNNASGGTPDNLVGLIDADQQAVFIDTTNFTVFRFTTLSTGANAVGPTLNATFNAFAGAGQEFPNALPTDTGSISATFSPMVTLAGSVTFGGSTTSSTFSLSYDASLYQVSASFGTIAGTYSFSDSTSAGQDDSMFTISSAGAVSGSDNSACTLAGSMTIPNSSFNAYEFVGTNTCAGTSTNVTGFAIYAPATGGTAATLTIEYDNGSNEAIAAIATKQ